MSSNNRASPEASRSTLTSPLISLSLGMPPEDQMERKELLKILKEKSLEGILFFSPENIRYLTGFSGSEGYLLAREEENLLMVDFRYITQAREETKGCRVALLEKRIKGLMDHSAPLGLKRLGFEAQGISVALFEQLQQAMEGIALVPIKEELERLRGLKTSEEITAIKGAIAIAERAWKKVLEMARPGMREDEVALELEYRMRTGGSEGVAFDPLVASGPRSALPHAKPITRALATGDLLLFDFGARSGGYCSDESCTVVLGRATEEQRRIYGIVKDAHDRAIEHIKPGIKLATIDAAARDYITAAGHGDNFGHGTGHGIGLAVHEWPTVGRDSPDRAEEGMTFAIEPGIYIPGWGGVRIEDMVRVTADGCEVLTTLSKDLMIIS
jgi:Xaa-Pro aminopeptidase